MKLLLIILISAVFLLTACGGGLSGTFVDESGTRFFEFSNDKVTIGMTIGDASYEESGTFETKDGVLIVTMDDTGDISTADYTLKGKVLMVGDVKYTKSKR